MPTRLLLEGPDIESLLSRVRDEHGSSARIVSADKVRTGGMAGFFAKEKFEVAVEVDERPAGAGSSGGRHAAGDVANDASAVPPGDAETGTDVAASLADLAERADDAERGFLTAGSAGSGSSAGRYRPRHGGGAQFEGGDVPDPARKGGANPASTGNPEPAGAGSTQPASGSFADVLAGLSRELPALPTPAPFRPAAPPTQVTSAQVTSAGRGRHAAADPLDNPIPARPAVAPPPVPVTPPAVAPPPAPVTAPPPLDSRIVLRLRELGLPAHVAEAAAAGSDPYSGLIEALAGLPDAPRPPSRPGDILVIAGDGAAALALAADAAGALRIDPAEVLYVGAGPVAATLTAARRISGPAEAERRARYLHRADVPHVIAVEAPMDGESADWARSVADAVGATAVWAVVDATRKTADLREHLRLLGPTAALAVVNTGATADPATVLDLGLPVASVDGRPATPAAWAALLCARLDRRR